MLAGEGFKQRQAISGARFDGGSSCHCAGTVIVHQHINCRTSSRKCIFLHFEADSDVTSKTVQCLDVFPEGVQNLNSWTSNHSRHFQLRIPDWCLERVNFDADFDAMLGGAGFKVGLVGAQQLTVHNAIPMIMGASIEQKFRFNKRSDIVVFGGCWCLPTRCQHRNIHHQHHCVYGSCGKAGRVAWPEIFCSGPVSCCFFSTQVWCGKFLFDADILSFWFFFGKKRS